jgi:dCMP deaminase
VRERLSWDDYFMEIAEVAAKRSSCLRRHVGAVAVRDMRVLATGYNGAPSGLAHCKDVGCLREQLNVPSGQQHELCRGLHAEQNVIIQAALHGVSIAGSTLYSTFQPCVLCAKMIINAGIMEVIFKGDYPDELALSMLLEADIVLRKYVRSED